jgi:cyclohexyl-isocyanide hydratase
MRKLSSLLGLFGLIQISSAGKFITAASVAAGIDYGLLIVAKLTTEVYAKAVQLYIEYDPQPPYNACSPEGVGEEISEALISMYSSGIDQLRHAIHK